MDDADRHDIKQKFEAQRVARHVRMAAIEGVDRLVRILQIVVPLAAAKQLGILEERLRVAREKLIPKHPMAFNIRSYDDEKAVEDLEDRIAAFKS